MKTNLGLRIKHYRELKGLSQQQLADALDVDKQTIWRWEKGRNWPEFATLTSLADQLGITLDDIFDNLVHSAQPPMSPEALVEKLEEAFSDKHFCARFAQLLDGFFEQRHRK